MATNANRDTRLLACYVRNCTMSGMAEKLEHILFGELGRMQSNLDNDEFDFAREENKLGHVGSMLMARPVISAICAAFRGRSAKLS